MTVLIIAGVSTVLTGATVCGLIFRHQLGKWLRETYQTSPFYEVLKVASGEVAVLLFVFPMIDMLGKDDATKHRNWPLVIGSVCVGFVFIFLAGIFAQREKHEEKREEHPR